MVDQLGHYADTAVNEFIVPVMVGDSLGPVLEMLDLFQPDVAPALR